VVVAGAARETWHCGDLDLEKRPSLDVEFETHTKSALHNAESRAPASLNMAWLCEGRCKGSVYNMVVGWFDSREV
jgi:hypothetical protein